MTAAAPTGTHLSIAVLKHSNVLPFERRRGRTFRCHFNCYQDFDVASLREHMRARHSAHLFRAAEGVLRTAMRVDITDLKCTICNQSTPDLDALEQHLVDAHRMKIFKNTADVLVPYKLQEGDYRCQLCGLECGDFSTIDAHMETAHFPLNICEVCGRGFMSVKRLKAHAVEHAEKKFVCETCNAGFHTEYFKRRHVDYIHKGIGFLICAKCPGLRFKDHNKKLEHMEVVHDRKRTPTPDCPVCGKSYKHLSSLTSHIKVTHQAVKPLKCAECTETFARWRDLDNHRRSAHTGERVPCVYCGRGYASLKELSRHMKRAHAHLETRCPCYRCGKPCENRCKLKTHIAEEHGSC